jgi:hypothetical protein
MILDGSQGWYWYLKSLPERVREHDVPVRFSIIEREVEDSFCFRTMLVANNIEDADSLLGILFDESLKSKCIAEIDESTGHSEAIYVNIFLVQGEEGCTNIDSDVMDSFAKVFQK